MTVPSLFVTATDPADVEADVLVVGVRKSKDGPVLLSDHAALADIAASLAAIGITGATDEVRRLPGVGAARSIALVGIGAGEPDPEALRLAAGSATRQLKGVDSVAFALPTADRFDVLAVLEGAALGAYRFTHHKSAPAESARPASAITVVTEVDVDDAVTERASAVATAVSTVRDLVNTSPAHLYPASFAERASELADGLPVSISVLDETELEVGGFGGIAGVGRGSERPPRLVTVRYEPAGASKHLALVGKGITFDSGGLSLKPAASMVGMKYDMTGAATVLAVTLAAARIGLPIRITAWLCLAENMPSGSAIRPNDVLTIRGGTTVEVLNTDAEGRLVLADGLVAASEEHPDAIVDVATLTGAARVALGDRYAAIMGDETFVEQVVGAAKRSGEPFWPMPLPAELRQVLDSDVADIANAKPGNTAAGMLLAGIFLSEFVGSTGDEPDAARIPWAHLDIAGPANNGGGGWGFTGRGPTGVTVRALIELADELALA